MTQMSMAKDGIITPEMEEILKKENISEDFLIHSIQAGKIAIIPSRTSDNHIALGEGLTSKILSNIGTSTDSINSKKIIEFVKIVEKNGASIICDQSSGPKFFHHRKSLLQATSLPLAAIPLYLNAEKSLRKFKQDVNLIIKAKRGFSLQGVKRDYKSGKITLKDAHHKIFTIMTTEKPRGKTSSWASHTSLFYRRRWLIETGFSDLNRINHRWKSNYDNLRYLDMLARMLLYNSWKMNKKLIKVWARQEGKVKEWTLYQNQDYLKELFLATEKKSQWVIG